MVPNSTPRAEKSLSWRHNRLSRKTNAGQNRLHACSCHPKHRVLPHANKQAVIGEEGSVCGGGATAGAKHKATRWGHRSELDIVTFTAELSSENKPLRWTAFSLILFVWNSLACCVWAFFCRTTRSTWNKKGSRQSRPLRAQWDKLSHKLSCART